jgi:hypothetical protein
VISKLDLGAIASDIDTPFRPEPFATLGAVEASLFVCEGQKGWHRRADAGEVAYIIEGVMTIESADGIMVADEGDAILVPEGIGLNFKSGMRTTVALFHESDALAGANGQPAPPGAPRAPLTKANVGVDVLSAEQFHWQDRGSVGEFRIVASRLQGAAAPLQTSGPMLAIVYRGVLDFSSDAEAGSIVGSEALYVPGGTNISLSSERGATVLVATGKRSDLPAKSGRGAVGSEHDEGRGADMP